MSKKIGIIFLGAVILSFVFGYYVSRILPFLPLGPGRDMFELITENFHRYYYYDIEDDQVNEAFIAQMEAIIESYARQNNDPYTRLIATPLSVEPSSDEYFIGLGISFSFENLNIRVLSVYIDAAADGLLYPNDLIVGIVVDDEMIYFENLDDHFEVLELLSGDLGDQKELLVINPDQQMYQLTVTYELTLTPSAFTIDLEENDISYLRIARFNEFLSQDSLGTSKIFSDILIELEQTMLMTDPESKTLILDLRDNPGGALSALHNQGVEGVIPGIVQQLIVRQNDQSVFSMVTKNGREQNFYGGLIEPKPYQIKVLVNQNSASAAEVLAAALHVNGGYEIYGEPTFGKGVYQNQIRLIDYKDIRYALVYTEGEWFYNGGKNISEDPISLTIIQQEGLLTMNVPIYYGLMKYNDVNLDLIAYQKWLNLYLNLDLRVDGYFDLATENAVVMFQEAYNLTVTGHIDNETARQIHDLHMRAQVDRSQDLQLNRLINMIKDGV
jgi:carboxyl-terminal processing protease